MESPKTKPRRLTDKVRDGWWDLHVALPDREILKLGSIHGLDNTEGMRKMMLALITEMNLYAKDK